MPLRHPGRRWPLVAVGVGLLLAVPVALLVAWRGFAGLYGQDSFFYQAYAVGALRDAIVSLRPLPLPDFTWSPGYPLLVSIGSLVLGTGSLAGQVVSLGAGTMVPVLTVLLGRELAIGDRAGPRAATWLPLLAGAIVALTPHLWQSSAVVMSDTTGLAAATLGAWGVVRYARVGSLRWLVLGAVAIAFAIDVRWVYALVALPLGVAGLLAVWHRDPRRVAARHMAVAAAGGALVLAPIFVPMLVAAARGEPIPFAIQLQSHGWDPANMLRSSFDGPDGHFDFPLSMGAFYLLEPAQAYHQGPLFALLAVVGVGAVLVARPDALRIAVLVAWPALVMGFLAGDTTQNTRFMLAVLPPIALLAATGVGALAMFVERGGRRVAALGPAALVAVVVLGLGVQAASAVRVTDAFIVRQATDLAAIGELELRVPAGERVVSFGATLALQHDGIDAIELYHLEPPQLLALVADGRRTWLVLPSDGIDEQWAAKPPGRDVAALRAGPGLTVVARAGSWTLYVVGRP